jgi:AcrR family transcriptional regulator
MAMNDDKKALKVEQRKDQILAAAKHIFATNGFRRTHIDQIAEYLNVGKGTLYRYFPDKKSLFLAIFEQGMNHLYQTIIARVEPIADPRQKIATAVKMYFAFFDADKELIEITMQVRSEFKDDYSRLFMALHNNYIVRIQENLREGISTGVFRDLDVERTAEAMSATLQGVLQTFYIKEFKGDSAEMPAGQKISLSDMAEAVTTLLLEGVLKR